ncbi:MAG: GNAT family N-acetyltransferase [Herpetosiphon sp.]|nr:GNAT family N-acetyltransferase [Herpetosiphon sp.]
MIRRATVDDAPAIAHVHIAAWQNSYRSIVPDEILDNLAILQYTNRWQETLKAGKLVFIAEHDGQIVGFAQGDVAREPQISPYTAELNTIYLLPDLQGHGLGRQLFDAVVESLKHEHRAMLLWVLKDNQAARGFYEHLGGKVIAEAPTRMGDPPLLKVAYGFEIEPSRFYQ